MSTVYANTISLDGGITNLPIYADRAEKDQNGDNIEQTYAKKSGLATVATSGDYDDLTNKPSIPAAQVNADWNASSGVVEILNKPQNLVQDASYVHTDNNFTTSLKDKLDGIASGAEVNVQSDWSQSDSSADDFIKNKPTINNVPAVTSADDDKVLKASYSGGVGSYAWENDISDVPSYSTSDDRKVLGVVDNQGTASLEWVTPAAGTVTDVEVNGSSVVSGGVASITIPAQVQTDWLERDPTDPAYLLNKPSIPVVPPTKDLVAGTGINIVQGASDVTISATDGVPAVTSFDDAKVLTATYSGGAGSFAWASLPAAPTLSSLNTAGITDIQVVSSLPASPVSTVLYLIQET